MISAVWGGWPTDFYRTPWIIAQCPSMPIKSDQIWSKLQHWSQCWSIPIIANQCRSIPLNSSQLTNVLLMPWSGIDLNWLTLKGILDQCQDFDWHWSAYLCTDFMWICTLTCTHIIPCGKKGKFYTSWASISTVLGRGYAVLSLWNFKPESLNQDPSSYYPITVGNVLPVTRWLILSSAYKSWQSFWLNFREKGANVILLNWSTALWDTIVDCQDWYAELSVNHLFTLRPSRCDVELFLTGSILYHISTYVVFCDWCGMILGTVLISPMHPN